MKKTVSVILALVLIMLPVFSAVPAASENVHIMIDKTWKILLPENPTDAEQFTAGKLKECLSEVFGAEIEAVSSADEEFIAVGSASACKLLSRGSVDSKLCRLNYVAVFFSIFVNLENICWLAR